MIKIEKILFPTDFSNYAEHALQYALSFAELCNAKLYVLHVITDLSIPVGLGGSVYPLSKIYDEMEQNAKEKMKHVVPMQYMDKIETETIIVRGTPFLEIINTAKKYTVDLITIATHGHTGLSHVFLGSTAEKVVRMAPCPVLTIKHPEHEFVTP